MSTVPSTPSATQSTLRHLVTSVLYTIVTIVLFGFIYPAVIWGIATIAFPHQANGSLVTQGTTVLGSELVGQSFSKPGYFHPRLSAAGKGYDPTQTGGTNYGPTSKKLIDGTKAAIAALRKDNPDATGPIPPDLVTSSASGIDPDISPEGADYQVARVAKARGLSVDAVRALVAAHLTPRTLGFLGEPRVNVFALNRALDAQQAAPSR